MGKELRFDIKKLIQEIASYESIDQLTVAKGFSEADAIKWLDQVIQYALDLEELKLLNEFAVIPNQYGAFKKKDELWQDLTIPSQLKSVLKKLGTDWKNSLQHAEITAHAPQIEKSQEDIIGVINSFIKNYPSQSSVKGAVLDLTSFISEENLPSESSRAQLWKFTKDFFKETPEMEKAEGIEKSAWEESDKWLVKSLCSQISACQNVTALTSILQKPAVSWLHDFVIL